MFIALAPTEFVLKETGLTLVNASPLARRFHSTMRSHLALIGVISGVTFESEIDREFRRNF